MRDVFNPKDGLTRKKFRSLNVIICIFFLKNVLLQNDIYSSSSSSSGIITDSPAESSPTCRLLGA